MCLRQATSLLTNNQKDTTLPHSTVEWGTRCALAPARYLLPVQMGHAAAPVPVLPPSSALAFALSTWASLFPGVKPLNRDRVVLW
jgi:hypothetical protein